MRKQLKSIVVAGMIATLSFATLAGCGSKSTAKNDETTISDTVKQTQKQTEKTTDATTGAATETAVTTENTDVDNTIGVTSEPDVNVESNESDYEVSYEPDTPAYVPDTTDTTDTEPADTPADEPVDNTPAPTEPAVHEHNWVPTYCYIEWIASQTTSEDQYVPGGTVTVTRFEQAGQLTDHYECNCGATKDGENKSDIAKILSTKNVPEGGIAYYTNSEYFFTNLRQNTPSYSGYGPSLPPKGQW